MFGVNGDGDDDDDDDEAKAAFGLPDEGDPLVAPEYGKNGIDKYGVEKKCVFN